MQVGPGAAHVDLEVREPAKAVANRRHTAIEHRGIGDDRDVGLEEIPVGANEVVEVRAADGEFLATAAFNPQSQIVGRVWDWREREIDSAFFFERVSRAVALRERLLPACDAVRLVHAESDGLPGVVVDRYGDAVVMQLSSAGAMRWRDVIADALEQIVKPKTIFERSDADVLALEGLQPQIGLVRGAPPPPDMTVNDAALKFEIDVPHGHKTGFYLDQRDNRLRLRELAAGCEVLDCFAYSGGFTINALKGEIGRAHV